MAYNAGRQPNLCHDLHVILQRCSNPPQRQIEVYSSVVDALAEHSYLLTGSSKQSSSASIQQSQRGAHPGGVQHESDDQIESVPDNASSDGATSNGSRGENASKRKQRKRANKTRAAQHKAEHDKMRQGLLPSLRRSSVQKQPEYSTPVGNYKSSAPHHRDLSREQTRPNGELQAQHRSMPEPTVNDRNKALGLPPLERKTIASSATLRLAMRQARQGKRPSVRLVSGVDTYLTPPSSPPWTQNMKRRSAAEPEDDRWW